MKYVCSLCGYVYDEAANTPWAAAFRKLADWFAAKSEADTNQTTFFFDKQERGKYNEYA